MLNGLIVRRIVRLIRVWIAFLPICGIAQTTVLPFRPVAAEYSAALDRMIMVSVSPNQLHICSVSGAPDVIVDLSKPPLSVAIDPDGMHAAVGHDNLISYVD